MSAIFKQIIENIGKLSSEERAMVAHCLISSLEAQPEDGVGDAWAELAEKRFSELDSGVVTGTSWQDVKSIVKG